VTVAADGAFEYQPESGFDGSDRFEYVAVSDEGTSDRTSVTVTGEMPPIVRVVVRPVDASGRALTSVTVGQEFHLQGLVEDLRDVPTSDPRGVYDVDMQVRFDADVVSSTGDVALLSVYDAFSFGETRVLAGAFEVRGYSGLTATGLGEQEVFRAPMVATAVGEVDLTISDIGEVRVMRFGTIVSEDLIEVVDARLTVEARSRWQNPKEPLDTNDDGSVAPTDVLLGVNVLNSRGAVALRDNDLTRGGKRVYLDCNGDAHHAPGDILMVVNHLNTGETDPEGTEKATATAATQPQVPSALRARPEFAADGSRVEPAKRPETVESLRAPLFPGLEPPREENATPARSTPDDALSNEELLTLLAEDIFELWYATDT
jgi:hypothetical protein